MKKSTNQNKSGMIDWMMSIDFDPVEITHVRRELPTQFVSILEKKAIEPKKR